MDEERIRAHLAEHSERRTLVMRCAKRHLRCARGGNREAQMLAFASIGLADREIAWVIGFSPDTVSTYWTRVFKQLGVTTRTEAVAIVLEREIASLSK